MRRAELRPCHWLGECLTLSDPITPACPACPPSVPATSRDPSAGWLASWPIAKTHGTPTPLATYITETKSFSLGSEEWVPVGGVVYPRHLWIFRVLRRVGALLASARQSALLEEPLTISKR
jgi:hypothetical protein